MHELSTPQRREELKKATPAQKEARERMALFPINENTSKDQSQSEVIFVEGDKWVPVVRLGGKVSYVKTLDLLSR